jgi:Asp-tRNA(Asn)/Glu-tRNA(Gln) amidotransferase B subunit
MKNLNSVRAVSRSIELEVERQIAILESGQCVVSETRAYDLASHTSSRLRSKEQDTDYRFLPCPDLKPLVLDNATVAGELCALPELPDEQLARYVALYGLSTYEARILVDTSAAGGEYPGVAPFFEEAVAAAVALTRGAGGLAGCTAEDEALLGAAAPRAGASGSQGLAPSEGAFRRSGLSGGLGGGGPTSASASTPAAVSAPARGLAKGVAALLLNDILGRLKGAAPVDVGEGEPRASDFARAAQLLPAHLGELTVMLQRADVSSKAAKEIVSIINSEWRGLTEAAQPSLRPSAIAAARGLLQVSDPHAVQAFVDAALADPAMAESVAKYLKGSDNALGPLVKGAIDQSKGRANPAVATGLIRAALDPRRLASTQERKGGPKNK